MTKWFVSTWEDIWPILVSAMVVYLAVIIYTRMAGKRSFSKMSSFDFAVTIAIGSLIASTVVSKSVSLLQGLTGLAAMYVLQMLIAAMRRFGWVQKMVDNQPLLLMDGQKVLEDNMRKARVSLPDLRGKLREANVTHRQQIRAVVFESTGDVSVLHTGEKTGELDPWIMEGVNPQ